MNPLRRRIQTAMQSGGGAAAWTPASIAGLKVWLDVTDAANVTVATGASQINDLSGNGNHATQATASNQPAYTSGQYIACDGVDDWMEIPALGASGINPRSFTARIYYTAAQSGWIFGYYQNNAESPIFGAYVRDATNTGAGKRIYFRNGTLSQGFNTGPSAADQDGAWVSIAVVRTFGSLKLYINGVLDSTLSTASYNDTSNFKHFLGTAPDGNTGGWGLPFSGRMSRLLVYDAALTAADVTNLYNAGY